MTKLSDNKPETFNVGSFSLDTQSIKNETDGMLYIRESNQGGWEDWINVSELQSENKELRVFKEVVVNITRSTAFKNLAIDNPDVYSALINEMKLFKEVDND